ncbi:MAG: heavy metal translocating P-type ATPase [Candidatus Methanofastidiosia archaeon]
MEQYKLQGLSCADCAFNLEKELSQMDSVNAVHINFATGTLSIDCQDLDEVTKKIKETEPDVTISRSYRGPTLHKNRTLIILSLMLFVCGLLFRERLHQTPYSWAEYSVFLTVYLLVGRTVLRKAALNSVRGHIFDENFLMTVATTGAILIHQLPEAAGVMLFFSVGEYFEDLSVSRSRKSVGALLKLRPDSATLRIDDNTRQVDPREVHIGDVIVVAPGERIPLDGVMIEGHSTVNTSALTGESMPREIEKGDTVLAGMINKTGAITVRVLKPFAESSISRILDLVEHAAARKAEPEKFITRFARVYTPVVVGAALCVAVIPPVVLGASFFEWTYRALVLLVISCPCALVISIPLGYFGGIGKASREGILIKGANFLDALTELNAVVFDKTGTLTKGAFTVSRVVPAHGFTEENVLRYAALTEQYSTHPIARSIVEGYLQSAGDTVTDYQEIPARGVKAIVDGKTIFVGNDRQLHEEMISHDTCNLEGTVAHVTVNGVYAGYILISDEVKEDAVQTIQTLKEMGIIVVMLTGDSKDAAECVAQELGILRFYSELLPEEKVLRLEEMKESVTYEKKKVAFVGDGINDAPVIARADIGIAMGALGSDAAVETADVVIMTDHLYKLVKAINIGRKTSKIVWQNIVMVLGVKGVFIFMGILGVATMWEAVFADVGVALMAVFNAARILRM